MRLKKNRITSNTNKKIKNFERQTDLFWFFPYSLSKYLVFVDYIIKKWR